MPAKQTPNPEPSITAAIEVVEKCSTTQALADADLQRLLALAVRLYAARAIDLRSEGDARLEAFPVGSEISATEVMTTASAMLKAVNVQVFELGMYRAWAGS